MTYRPTQLQPATNALNTAAIDAALHANDYDNAIALYNEAISVQPDAEALYCNRSAVHLATGDWQAALQDADKAIALAPQCAHAHARRAAALSAGGRSMGAVLSIQRCVDLEDTADGQTLYEQYCKEFVTPRHLSKPPRTLEDQLGLGDRCGDDVAFAFARGFDLALPENATGADAKMALIQHTILHPDDGNLPLIRGLYLPSPAELFQAPRAIVIDRNKGTSPQNWEEVLNCTRLNAKVIYDENLIEKWRGNEEGVGIGYLYCTYHMVLDGTIPLFKRVPNPEAARLLRCPDAYGSVVVMKATRISNGQSTFLQAEYVDAVSWEVVTKEELESEEWQEMRREYDEMPMLRRDFAVNKKWTTCECFPFGE